MSEEEEAPSGAGPRPPVQMLGRIARVFLAALAVMIALSLVWFVSGALDSFVLRVAVGLILFLIVASLGVGYFRQVANPPPPDPVPAEVHPGLRLAYICDMCGLELAVLKVARDKAPKHCGETMLLVRRPAPDGMPDGAPEMDPEPDPNGRPEQDPGATV